MSNIVWSEDKGWHDSNVKAVVSLDDAGRIVTTGPFWGACGVEGCDRCRPLFDQDNNPIPGTES